MTTRQTTATHRAGAKTGHRVRQWHVKCEPQVMTDAQRRLSKAYRLLLQTQFQVSPLPETREE